MWTPVDAANMQTASHVKNGAKRYFPVAIAEKEIADYTARKTAFSTKLTAYNTAKTAYEAYLVKAAVKPDLFTSIFAPPAAIPIVVRPDLPSPPEAYTGLYAWPMPAASYASTSIGANAANKVNAGEFVVDGETGGYGSWTMGSLKPVVGGDMEKSFGVFGWAKSTATYKASEQSYSRNWNDMCITTDVANQGYCPTTTVAMTSSTKLNVICLSIWANDFAAKDWNDGTATNKSSLTLYFSVSKWKKNFTAWTKPASAAAGVAAKKPTGAKIIAASAAVATAVAAALF